MVNSPDFFIIGSMKCATSTLHAQLALQPGIFMTHLKEPNYFSDDQIFRKGQAWYLSHFQAAQPTDICGESSTHYTKLPTYPQAVNRLLNSYPEAKLIYIMRHPIDRLISQFIHEWSQRVIDDKNINKAIKLFPEWVDYSRYTYQLTPYFQRLPRSQILPVFFEKLIQQPQVELERIGTFLGYSQKPQWSTQLDGQNRSSQRLRHHAVRDFVLNLPWLKPLRRTVIPQELRGKIRSRWTFSERPQLSESSLDYLRQQFDPDLAMLGAWLGIELTCQNFKQQVTSQRLEWRW
ncbi:MAG: hypothetical protein RLZZ568_1344 [Cyanobacteriota bacterium]